MGRGSCNERDLSIKVECRTQACPGGAPLSTGVTARGPRSRAGSVVPFSLGQQGHFTQRIGQLFAGYCAAAGITLGLRCQAYLLSKQHRKPEDLKDEKTAPT